MPYQLLGRVQGEVRVLMAWKGRGWLEDKGAAESVCTFLERDPEEATGWECLERLTEQCVQQALH